MTETTHPTVTPYEEVGPLFGQTNMMTRPRALIQPESGPVDDTQIAVARRHLGDRSRIHDMILHGVRVRLFTNSHHLYQFARDYFYSAADWRAETGAPLPRSPHAQIFATTGVADQPGRAIVDPQRRIGLVLNSAHFGTLRAAILAAAAEVLETDFGILTLSAAAVSWNDRVAILSGRPGSGTTACAMALSPNPGHRFFSDGALHVRFVIPASLNRKVHPFEIAPKKGPAVKGTAVWDWLEANPEADGTARVLRADHRIEEIPLSELTRGEPPRPMAYLSEKTPYVRTNLVQYFPEMESGLKKAKLENVPAEGFASGSDSCALLDLRGSLGPVRAWTDPLEPAPVACLFRVRRDPGDPAVADTLKPESARGALERRLIRAVPGYGLNLVRPPAEMARLISRLMRNPPERAAITTETLDGYLN